MKKLKYNGTLEWNELQIDAMRTTEHPDGRKLIANLYRSFGVEEMPQAIMKITFDIRKHRTSWVEFQGKKIYFEYDIKRRIALNLLREPDKAWEIILTAHDGNSKLNMIRFIPVSYDCNSKKIIIKDILENIAHYGK